MLYASINNINSVTLMTDIGVDKTVSCLIFKDTKHGANDDFSVYVRDIETIKLIKDKVDELYKHYLGKHFLQEKLPVSQSEEGQEVQTNV